MSTVKPVLRGNVAILGGGKIGEALLSGLLRETLTPDRLQVVEKYPERAVYLARTYGIEVTDYAEVFAFADTIVLAVKPQDIETLLADIHQYAEPRHIIVSVAAGITTAKLEAGLPAGVAVVRCMPNTPALVDEAITAISPGAHADADHLAVAEALLLAVGQVVHVPESQLDAVTALSGSGPAYFFFLVEAMIDAGILLGLPRALSAQLIVQTAIGSAVMLRDSGEHPVQLREAVTSPGGTTIAAIRELENHGVRAALLSAIEAACLRSRELGRG
ncbi:pyrroline-5-carboxylate reductase [Jatrophihabitans sp. GAS493]|uniref:pyrroline-5-carboxylate reductase n=1 Tax=Jatrophihabitans sp. GAS493 TaxID=1907575 RepID=UPI000BB8BA18|nr:pyrroline-5-carboxylate reductase [Jatrophihabitans sp. GAS493]SOD70672.1 pyrroline-5-carboxylate reductase [Jatrophihabitans sp. GAS493]